MRDEILVGDCRASMRKLIDAGVRVQCVVTSPPYWGLRDYGVPGQFGLERTWLRHVARMRGVFRLARELLADDGTLWLNYGDSYANNGKRGGDTGSSTLRGSTESMDESKSVPPPKPSHGLKPKDLVGMPWRVAFALQADGWYLRSDIIWAKPNPMPESMTDRPTKSHEHLFLMSRTGDYYYDAEAIREESVTDDPRRPYGSPGANAVDGRGKQGEGKLRAPANVARGEFNGKTNALPGREAFRAFTETRNARDVWSIPTTAFAGGHFAVFPRELVRRCILAGSRPGDTIFDPFMGSGTVAEVALGLGRHYLGCELNPEYAAMFKTHRSQQEGLRL